MLAEFSVVPIGKGFLLRWTFILMTVCVLSSGCTPQITQVKKEVQTYTQSQEVFFQGIKYKIYESYWVDYVGGPYFQQKANAKFLVIDLSITNIDKKPREQHFAPNFILLDEQETEYVQGQNLMQMNSFSLKLLTQPINPNVEIRGKLTFDVPMDKKYRLRVLSPHYARVSFAGSIRVLGEYFYFDIFPQEKSLTEASKVGRIGVNVNNDGVIIAVIDGSPAATAGLQVGDKIIRIDGQPIIGGDAFNIAAKVVGEPGAIVELTILRYGQETTFKVERKILQMD